MRELKLSGGEVLPGDTLLVAGEILRFEQAWGFDASSWWAGRLHVIGTIRYTDDNGVSRRTGFYRTATADRNRFVKARIGEDALAEYEYED